MDRRGFISGSALAAAGWISAGRYAVNAESLHGENAVMSGSGIYELFRTPEGRYRPFVRWWWNGNKVEAGGVVRELRLLKEAGIGGVEMDQIKPP
ncbi:MAG: hypothetical protein U5L72_02460 [Bacteroidales bacterium]|nr:hypothetical protein [Bacteroidales bacterium]